ncbi:protein tramtrack, beta isoform isoform X2 [Zootermopsis nevadensis]|uniref:protein tramtrack, beta isoform isoform X2 n=1 Tax=Zootermopsis nevadensis TaxID=136037 RepID=UPI000B8E6A9B|nr:protein tramtrack, beta isoform isoform X2 [Zootermopsis nevadensis]
MTSALSSQRFCLRWNNHQSNLLSVFDRLLQDESFVDVTLAAEGRLLRAHKMVLSACSPYFQALFIGHPDKHPIVILKDVPYCDMKSLLDFMYRGEVSVDQDRLTAFLKVAESLRIKGLTEVNEEKCDLPSITSSLLSSVPPPVVTTHTPPPPHLHRIHPTSSPHKRSIPMPSASSATSSNPLLGSALTAPKRKRGRPRKLSGSSGGAPTVPGLAEGATSSSGSSSRHQSAIDGNGDAENSPRLPSADSLVAQGSPELLEVKMGMEFQHSPATNSGASRRPSDGENGSGPGPNTSSTEEGKAPNKEAVPALHSKHVKEEPEPTPGPSSQDPGQAFVRPSSTNNPEQYALVKLEEDGTNDVGYESSLPDDENELITLSPSSSTTEIRNSEELIRINLEGETDDADLSNDIRDQELADVDNTTTDVSILPDSDFQAVLSSDAKHMLSMSESTRQLLSLADDCSDLIIPPEDFSHLGLETSMSTAGLGVLDQDDVHDGSARRFCVREADNVFRCKVCNKTYTHISNFCRHYLTTHRRSKQVFTCPLCNKEFTRRDNMMTHVKGVHRV